MEIITDKIQPLGSHNPEAECVRTSCVSHLVKYDFSHLNPFQSKFALEVDKEDSHVVVLAPTCAGKCIRQDSIVLTSKGMMQIGEIGKGLEPGGYRQSKNTISTPLTDSRIDAATQIYRDGISESIKIKTNLGYELCATPSHRVKVVSCDGDIIWKYMKDLGVGDICVLSKGQKMFGNGLELTEIDGYMHGCNLRDDDASDSVPLAVRVSPREVVAAYIRGIYKTHGWIVDVDNAPCVALRDEKIAEQLQVILLNFGIVSKRAKKRVGTADLCVLSILPSFTETFTLEIGLDLHGELKDVARHATETYLCKDEVVFNVHKLLAQLKTQLKAHGATDESPVSCSDLDLWCNEDNWRTPSKSALRDFMSWIQLQSFCKGEVVEVVDKINYLLREDFFFDKIKSIDTEVSDNYDFVVPETNSFVGNGFVNHNTVVAELSIAQNILSGNYKKKAIYLAPMKALAEEKLDDWSSESHSFGNLKIAVLTGDHQMNSQKAAQLYESHIIVCTSEMLDSKTRNYHSNKWLRDVGVIVVDESHLIGSKGRGPRLETALMRFNEHNPDCRIVLMSATVPNANDYVLWLKRMTRKNSILVKSDYRPCKLNKHFIEFNDMSENKKKRYHDLEVMRMQAALDIISKFPNDQFLVFTGNKNWGKKFTEILDRRGFNSGFHNADLTLAKKKQIQDDFNSEKIQVLVASSTLAWGVNVNARRVILAHTAYGLEEMDTADIEQVCGRAGRIKYHTEGDAYILIPASKSFSEVKRITGGFEIKSKLNDPRTLMFHVVNEINSGKICNKEDLYTWYERSLAAVQNDLLTEETCAQVLNFLRNKRMIRFNEDENKWETTQLGAITSAMYMDPLDVADWFTNFSEIVNIGIKATGDNRYEMEENDIKVCWALANIYGYKPESGAFLSNAEKESSMVTDLAKRLGFMGPQTKVAAVYWYMLKGIEPDDCLRSLHFTLMADLERVFATLKLMHIKYGRPMSLRSEQVVGWKYDPIEWDALRLRIQYGVQRKYVPLVSLPEIGRVFAERLYSEGIYDKQGILNNKDKVINILGLKRAEKLYNSLNK